VTNLLIKQNEHLNALKGLAILIVVAEHAFMNYIPNFDSNYIFKYSVSFNMALFMFISGYLTFGKTINIRKKFLTLVIPFVL